MLLETVFDIEQTATQDWRIILSETLTVSDAAAFHAGLIDVLGSQGNVVVECGNAHSIDASILQLLMALQQGLLKQGRRFGLVHCSPEFTSKLQLVGVPTEWFAA